jgi:hypothetical protein
MTKQELIQKIRDIIGFPSETSDMREMTAEAMDRIVAILAFLAAEELMEEEEKKRKEEEIAQRD